MRLDAPITLVGFTALSVDIRINFSAPCFSAALAVLYVPIQLFFIASAALLFILPLIVAALCYGVMCILNFSHYASLGALGGIAVSYIIIFLIEKSIKKKKRRMKITEIVK